MEYKVIVAGGRDFTDYELVSRVLFAMADTEHADKEISIVSGMARGADRCGYDFAIEHNVVVHMFPANWDKYGRRAGYVRNEEMGNFSDALVAFWDGESRGTKHMIEYMRSINKPVTVINY